MMAVCIGKEEKTDGQGRERKVAVCGKVKVLHGG